MNKKGEGNSNVGYVVAIILMLLFIAFLIYFAIKSGFFIKLLRGKIL